MPRPILPIWHGEWGSRGTVAALPAPTVSTLPLVFLASHRPSGQPTLTATSRLPTDASVGQPPNAAPWDPGQQVGPLPGLLPTWQRDIASRKSGKWTPQRVGGRDCLVKLISPSTQQAPARAVEAYGLPDTLRQLGRARLLQGSFSGLTTGPRQPAVPVQPRPRGLLCRHMGLRASFRAGDRQQPGRPLLGLLTVPQQLSWH